MIIRSLIERFFLDSPEKQTSSQTSPIPSQPAQPIPPPIQSSAPSTPPETIYVPPIELTDEQRRAALIRQANQIKLLVTGAGLLGASIFISRRAVGTQIRAAFPAFYTPNRTLSKVDKDKQKWRAEGGKLAAQAFGLATLNIIAFGFMLVGGIGWAFDISSMKEIGERTRESIRQRRSGRILTPEEEKREEEEAQELWKSLVGDKYGIKLPVATPDGEPSEKEADGQ